jgi:dTDP-3-amino-2,3,6-trideoxy-4-keto-D-glucose/dTDP-3-amino-3,4,6-trideoxy-alpha-D-glucose/dTDP-2,6-dideoxy-D-kanosamine transaminase
MTLVKVPLNDLRREEEDVREAVAEAARRVVESGWYVFGPEHDAFEQEFASFIGVSHVIGTANGTDSLELALRAIARGRRVVVAAANAGGYAATAAARAGLDVRYADVDPETLCLTAETIRPTLDDDVGAVVLTHLYGRLAAVEEVAALCRPLRVAVVEDCAQAVGASRDGRRAGTFGDVAAFSFYPTKNLGAFGDAGAVATNDDTVETTVRMLRQYGWGGRYRIDIAGGRNSRLDAIQAAVLRVRLPHVDRWNERRRRIVAAYADAAASSVRVLPADGPHHVAHLAVVETVDRDGLRATLDAAGIGTDIHYPIPDHWQPGLARVQPNTHLPVTERIVDRILTLPCFPGLRDDEIDRVCDVLAAA